MHPDRWRQIEAVCHEVLARAPAERGAFLDAACAGDAELRREVESLVGQASRAREFPETPAAAPPGPSDSSGGPSTGAALSAGTRLGPYEIAAFLGAGGMGEVYQARDTMLNRDVALKVLPASIAGDRDRLARFRREAQVLAALNHPNIAQIYGVEDSSAGPVIVMEFVGGPALDDVIARGSTTGFRRSAPGGTSQKPIRGLPWDEALALARQIALALEAAHEQGIVHRDLKPGNIKVCGDGTIKVLDFGLAKAIRSAASSGAAETDSPTTVGSARTESGMILGTAGYMSPEQARGRPLDRRTDIWAFGVLLFELRTGQRLFGGDTTSDRLASVLRQDIPWDRLPAGTPGRLRRLLEQCLERDPRRRLRDAGDAEIEIEDILANPHEPASAAIPAVPAQTHERLLWVVLAAAALGVGWWIGIGLRSSPPEAPWTQFTQLTDEVGEETAPAISPHGDSLAYASRAAGSWDIYVSRIGGRNPIVVAGDPKRDESAPAWSPDGRFIALHEADTDGGIFIMGATGESARRLTDAGFHPTWSPDGRSIAFCQERVTEPHAQMQMSALSVVDVATGRVHQLTKEDAVQPAWSPSGARIAFWGSFPSGQRDLFTIPASGGEPVPVTQDAPVDWGATWAPDGRHLYFASDRGGAMNLWRVAIDEASGRRLGEPEPVTAGVERELAMPSLSADGRKLVFQAFEGSINPVVVPFDPGTEQAGTPTYLFRRSGHDVPASVSPDGQWLALNRVDRREDILVSRIDGTGLRNLTQDQAMDRFPAWSPDGSTLFFASSRSGSLEIWTIRRDGSHLQRLSDRPGHNIAFPLYDLSSGRLRAFDNDRERTITLEPAAPAPEARVDGPVISVEGGIFVPTGISRDGARLAGLVRPPNTAGIVVGWHDLRTGETGLSPPNAVTPPAWLPGDQRLVYVATNRALVVFDTRTGRERVVRTLPFDVSLLPPAVSPDGRSIFLGAASREADIWMVERGR